MGWEVVDGRLKNGTVKIRVDVLQVNEQVKKSVGDVMSL